ncbi:MAG: hypothetical protein NTY65_09365 [Planctomycetota bacterium]|nr:hypothetical protein [Planctomycetota bacterium]
MMRLIALLLSLAVCLAGCGQTQAVREEKAVKKQAGQEEKAVEKQAGQEGDAVSAILKLGGKVERDEALPGRPIVEVDLSKTKVTDADLKGMKELKGLQRLLLGDTTITDAGLKDLKELKGLKNLGLAKTQITDAGLKDLKQALPETDILGP